MITKACELDPIPTVLLKLCLDDQLPLITHIVNLSFQTAEMPDEYKLAILIPLLKKIGLQLIFKNYGPISNLSFVSKLNAMFQLVEHMKSQNLLRNFNQHIVKVGVLRQRCSESRMTFLWP